MTPRFCLRLHSRCLALHLRCWMKALSKMPTLASRSLLRSLGFRFLLLCALPCAPAWGSNAGPAEIRDFSFTDPYFQSVGDNEAIPSGVVTSLAQDHSGILWIGTEGGLIRYDGYRFRKYVHTAENPHSLAGDYVSALYVDADGYLWIGTSSDGLSRFDAQTEQFENYRHDDAVPSSLGSGMTWAIARDASGGTWVGNEAGLDHLAPGEHAWRHFRHSDKDEHSLAQDLVHNLLVDRHGSLWVGTGAGLQRLRPDGKSFENVAVPARSSDADSKAASDVRALFEAKDGKIWFGTRKHGAAWIIPGKSEPHWLPVDPERADALAHGWVRAISQPQADNIWLGSYGGGLAIVNAADGRVEKRLRHDLSDPSSLALDGVGAMLTDRAGQLWLGTWGGGLQRYNPLNRAFRLLRHSPIRSESLSQSEVDSVLELDDGRILVGTDANGIDILDRQRGLIGGYRPVPGKHGALADAAIFGLAKTPDGALWAGTKQAGAMRLAQGATEWEGYGVAQGLPSLGVSKMMTTKAGELWVGTDAGIAHWQPAVKRFETFMTADGQTLRAHVYSIEEDGKGRLWAGTDAGLWVLEPDTRTLKAIHAAPDQSDGLSSDDIAGLMVDHKGALWVSTAQGFDRMTSWDGEHAQFQHMSAVFGHPGMSLGDGPMEDRQGRIWTDKFVLDPAHLRIYALSKADGLDIGTNWDESYGRTHDGLMLYGGTQGMAIIDPEKFQPWNYQPPVVPSEIKINGTHAPLGLLENGLTLSPEQRDFSVEFSALDFSAPTKNRYAYRLLGYDRDWIETDAEHRIASYGNLWPGDYTLEVRGSNRVGEWSKNELSIPVKVVPAFWQRGWFLLLSILLAGAAVYSAYRWRVAQLHAQAESLRNLVAQRTHELLEKNSELEQLSITDRLTGLYNRLYLDRTLTREMATAQRSGNAFSLILIDVDKFKSVNDTYGHPVGDQVLIKVSEILQSRVRVTDVAGRWGGEEFLVICPATDADGAVEVAEKLRALIEQTEFTQARNCTASFGVSTYTEGDTIAALVTRTDQALYSAKESGRNKVVATS